MENNKDFEIDVKILGEAGYEFALMGLALNKNKDPVEMGKVAERLAPLDYGHNKVLESIYVWLNVNAPRYVWQEMDTYRISTKQSQSTMHVVPDEGFNTSHFECQNYIPTEYLDFLNAWLKKAKNPTEWKRYLPEGFMQRRIWCMNYKTLRNLILQRRTHRLPHWKWMIGEVLSKIEHPELLPTLDPALDKKLPEVIKLEKSIAELQKSLGEVLNGDYAAYGVQKRGWTDNANKLLEV